MGSQENKEEEVIKNVERWKEKIEKGRRDEKRRMEI